MDLTNQLWINVFSYLNENDLKKLLVISKKFRRLVIESDELMRKLTLYIILDTWREKLEFLKVYGMFVKTVKISYPELSDFGELRSVFSLIRNVENVTINVSHYKSLNDDQHCNGSSIRFPHLKHLSIAARKCVFKKILNLLEKCDELESLTYDWKSFQISPEGDDFILQQKRLKNLKLTYSHATPFESHSLENVKFNLKSLIADFDIRKTETVNFHKFLSSQFGLEELILPMHWDVPYSIHELIFRKFHNLKKLGFNIFEEDEEALKLGSLNLTLKNVEELSVRTDPYTHSQESFQNVMNIFPNVKKLCVLGMDSFHFGSP
jgi:hypothetical protein